MTGSLTSVLNNLQIQLESIIVGQKSLLERLVIATLAGGHVLLEGPPGLAKTTAVHALAAGVDADYHRIQFTPDLMPSDLSLLRVPKAMLELRSITMQDAVFTSVK